MQLEKEIKEDVRKWSKYFLEVPNKHLGGMSACPFARKSWKDEKVVVEVKKKHKWYKTEFNTYLNKISFDTHDLLIFCDPFYSYTPNEFQGIVDDYNYWYNKKDIYFMGFHPSNPATADEQEFLVSPGDEPPDVESDLMYSMILAQKFSLLQEASDKLHKSGYYKLWPRGYYQDVVVSRYKTYRRIFGGRNGNEEEKHK